MNDLIALINSLSGDEVASFIAFAKARNQRTDVKNIQLFRLLRSGAHRDLDLKIYGKPNKNALHALTNRLKDSLVDFTASHSFANDAKEDLQLLKWTLAARIFLENGQVNLGFKTLRKAISKASSLELYAILQECYHTHVQYAHLDPSTDLEQIIEAYQKNQVLYNSETRLVMAYAILRRELSEHPANVYQVIKEQLLHFDITIDQRLSFKSLFQIMTIATDAATMKSDYAGVAIFMNHVYEIVELKKHLGSRNRHYYCEIVYLMAGTYFRNKDFIRSQQLITQLETTVKKHQGKHQAEFQERIILLQALNYNFSGQSLLARQTMGLFKKPSPKAMLVHCMFLFQQEEFQNARRKMNALNHSDLFFEKKQGLLWVLQKNVLEIMIYLELKQIDLVESKMRSFHKRFKSRLLDLKEERVLIFMNLLKRYFEQPLRISEKTFRDQVEKSFQWKTAEREDIFIMSFYAYLKARINKTPIYETTLELVSLS